MSITRGVLTAAAAVAVGSAGVVAAAPTHAADASQRNCAWTVELDPDGVNALYPDRAARYWVLDLPASPKDSLRINGIYPHARYTSLTSYDSALRSADGIPDVDIAPDRGSSNPFRTGADRATTARRRHYTVRVVMGRTPEHPARNTLYTESSDGSRQGTTFLVALRIYEPDKGLPDDGGVPLPSVTLDTPAGRAPLPNCATAPTPGSTNQTVADAPAPVTGSGSTTAIVWHKFYNLPTAVADNTEPAAAPATMALPKGGFADNPDNKYVSAVVSTARAPAVIIRGKLPVTPETFDRARRMPAAQLRYWSMCSNELASERFYGCLMDDQMPLAEGRHFTLVVTTAADRPANAVTRCGVAWLPAGPAPDTVLIERNMLPQATFRHSIQAARYGHEKHDLGAYYPAAHYATTAQVEKLGCHAPVNAPRRS